MVAAIQAQYRAVLEVTEVQRAQFDLSLASQQGLDAVSLLGQDKGHGGLHRQPHLAWAGIGRQPEFHQGAVWRIPPMPGQDEALLYIHRCNP